MAHKILMVEDDFALAMGTEYALTSEGYAVTTAGNLAQAHIPFPLRGQNRPPPSISYVP
jgi:DNA-binding NtrC family response regulator